MKHLTRHAGLGYNLSMNLSSIRLLALDVDGVLTPGEIIYLSTGEELKIYNAKDGHGLVMLNRAGIATALITARTSPANTRRAEDLHIPHVFQGVKNKLPVLQQLASDLGLTLDQVAYMGDDLPDKAILEVVGLPCCPADAVPQIRDVCQFISQFPGGRGAVRELCDLILAGASQPLKV
jgi:3-deoxy-D-manno-octulosonate 8-phosphate phosphatase (KDO 8-P phosphatase)